MNSVLTWKFPTLGAAPFPFGCTPKCGARAGDFFAGSVEVRPQWRSDDPTGLADLRDRGHPGSLRRCDDLEGTSRMGLGSNRGRRPHVGQLWLDSQSGQVEICKALASIRRWICGSQLSVGRLVFHETVPQSTRLGLGLIGVGGLVIQFGGQ